MTQSASHTDAALRANLAEFGFSTKEIDVYLTLLVHGEATTNTLSQEADVTQQAVYSITDRLEKRGVVRVNNHASPKTISAVSPERSMTNLSSRIDAMIPALEDRFTEEKPQTPELKIVHSRETAINRLKTAISQVEQEAFVAIPEYVYPKIETELRAAVDRDALVLLLVQGIDDGAEAAGRFSGAANVVRTWSERSTFIYVVDNSTANQTAFIGDADLLSGPHATGDGVAVSQAHLTSAILGLYYSAYWPVAAESVVTEPDPLPKTFEWFRQAIFQAALHDQCGTELRADVATTDGVTVSGRITGIRQSFIEPTTSTFPLENSLALETDDGTVSVGGPGAFLEEHAGASVTLYPDS
jgi:HTH-type transcriptional regulator, sugar sensing transcriptional regulator